MKSCFVVLLCVTLGRRVAGTCSHPLVLPTVSVFCEPVIPGDPSYFCDYNDFPKLQVRNGYVNEPPQYPATQISYKLTFIADQRYLSGFNGLQFNFRGYGGPGLVFGDVVFTYYNNNGDSEEWSEYVISGGNPIPITIGGPSGSQIAVPWTGFDVGGEVQDTVIMTVILHHKEAHTPSKVYWRLIDPLVDAPQWDFSGPSVVP